MAGNNSIQILRGSETYDPSTSGQVLLDGQPFYSKKNKKLYIGDGTAQLDELTGTQIGLSLENGTGSSSVVLIVPPDEVGNSASGRSAVAFGEENVAEGNKTFIAGTRNSAYYSSQGGYNSNSSALFGQVNMTNSTCTFVAGYGNKIGSFSGNTPLANSQGYCSAAFGYQNIVNGQQSFVAGYGNTVIANKSVAFGANNELRNNSTNTLANMFVSGGNNVIAANNSSIMGTDCYIESNTDNCHLFGRALNARYCADKTVVGKYNYSQKDTLFEVGNGNSSNRSNAFEVYENGTVRILGQVELYKRNTTEVVNIFDLIYPIGSIYLTVVYINPVYLFGGTWEIWGNGRVICGCDGSEVVESTGGSNNVSLVNSNIPSHTHTFSDTVEVDISHTHDEINISHTNSIPYSVAHTNVMRSKNSDEQASTLVEPITIYGFDTYNGKVLLDNIYTTETEIPSLQATTNITVSGTTGSVGNGSSFSVRNSYITCYMWKRVG